VIALSVSLTIFIAIPLFGAEMSWYALADVAKMSVAKLWENYLALMNYLINPFVGHLHMPDFPSSPSGLQHFAEVKRLFMIAFGLSLILIPAFVYFLKEYLLLVFHNGLRVVMLFPLAIGGVVLPEQFFMHTFLVFLLVYELIFFMMYHRGTLFMKRKY